MRNKEAASLQKFSQVLDYIVDPRVGIVRQVEEKLRLPGTPRFFHVYAEACNTGHLGYPDNFRHAGGASADYGVATAKAVGEAIERYCAAMFNIEELPLASAEGAGFRCIQPEEFALYSSRQYDDPNFFYTPFKPSTKIRWTESFDPLSGEKIYVPAAMVYIPYYYYEGSGDQPIIQSISTGLACHMGFYNSACSAICEVVERDAFTITWQAMLCPPQIIPESLSARNYDLYRRFEKTDVKVTIFDITMDHGVPTILSAMRANSDLLPAVAVAAASDLNPEAAVRSSLEELAHTNRYCQHLRDHFPLHDPGPNHEKIKDQASHLGFWALPTRRALSDFLFESKIRKDFDEIADHSTEIAKDNFRILCEKVKAAGHRVLISELTTPDVGDLGFCVTRALIPGFHPLQMGHIYRSLGGTRLWEIPRKLGYKGIKKETGDNPTPHPYP